MNEPAMLETLPTRSDEKQVAPSRESAPNRVVCPACGTAQTLRKNRKAACLICSKPLTDGNATDVLTIEKSEDAPSRPLIAAARQALAEASPTPFACEELDDVLRSQRRLTSLSAFVPLWGLWLISRSQRHTAPQKKRLAFASLAVTIVLVIGLAQLAPNAESRAAAKRARIEASLGGLSRLVRDYMNEHHALPDAAAWQRSAEAGDLRFFDPWGHAYRYVPGTVEASLGTYGRDDAPGGSGDDADVFITVTNGG